MAHDRAFLVSLGIALLFHLSAVTVFSIVIFFPRKEIDYYALRIVPPPTHAASAQSSSHRLRVPSLDTASPGKALESESGSSLWAGLPEIDLPTIEFAELRRLRVRQQGLDAWAARRESLFQPPLQDTWARFGRELGHLGSALSRLTLSDEAPADVAPVTRPARGFEAYILWVTEPRDRALLFAPPIEALWGRDPSALRDPITIEFTVNPEGRVVSVWSAHVDAEGVVTSAQNSLLKYRFEPVGDGQDQQATLHVIAARDEL